MNKVPVRKKHPRAGMNYSDKEVTEVAHDLIMLDDVMMTRCSTWSPAAVAAMTNVVTAGHVTA